MAALWIMFGTSGHKTPPPGLVLENYTWRRTLPRPIWAWKSIVDPRRTRRARTAHEFRYIDPGVRKSVPVFASLDDLRLNHYITRSEQELKAKLEAPEAATGGLRRARLEDLLRTDPRCVEETILSYAPALREALDARGISTEDGRPRDDLGDVCDASHAGTRCDGYGSLEEQARGGVEMGELPPGPRAPSLFQTMGWWMRPISFLERNRARYGKRFTIRLLGERVFVMLSDPADVKQVYTSPPDVLHPGEGARILAPVVGQNSVILLDGDVHLEQRKLMLPAFHGEKMQALSGLMREVAEREAERVAARRAGGPAPAPAGTDPRDNPPGGVRARPRPAPRRAARAPDADPRDGQHPDRDAARSCRRTSAGAGRGPSSCACGRSPTR